MKLANPRPGFCSVCFSAANDKQIVDCEVAFDGAPVLDKESRTITIIPWTGTLACHDDLYVCESCVREMRDTLGMGEYREVIRKQLVEVKKLEVENEHLRATVLRMRNELNAQLESAFGPNETRRRRVAA